MQNFCFQSQITLLKVEDFAYSSRKQRWNSQRKSWRRLRSSLITITNQKEKGRLKSFFRRPRNLHTLNSKAASLQKSTKSPLSPSRWFSDDPKTYEHLSTPSLADSRTSLRHLTCAVGKAAQSCVV